MAYPLINGAAVNASGGQDYVQTTRGIPMVLKARASIDIKAYAHGSNAMAIGTPKAVSGSDVVLQPWGIAMVRTLMAEVVLAQPSANVVAMATGKRAMRMGTPSAQSSTVVQAVGKDGLRMGGANLVLAGRATGKSALALGHSSVGFIARADGRDAMALGKPRAAAVARVTPGIAMVRSGRAATQTQGLVAEMNEGNNALHFGVPGPVGRIAYARQTFALALGRPTADRSHQC